MNYIKINEEKLKITLEAKDLEDWDIQIDELDYANPYARVIFEEFLAYAKKNFGFDSSGRKVLIHLYPSRDGGCEIFISVLDEKRSSDGARPSTRVYSFDRLYDMLGVCRRLCASDISYQSSAYCDTEGKWFLMLSSKYPEDGLADQLGFITEYGEVEDPSNLSLYLCEHAQPICEDDAVQTLGKI